MALVRRPPICDDDGGGNVGTVMNKAFFQSVFDYIDAKVAEGQQAAQAAIEARHAAEAATRVAEAAADRAMRFNKL